MPDTLCKKLKGRSLSGCQKEAMFSDCYLYFIIDLINDLVATMIEIY